MKKIAHSNAKIAENISTTLLSGLNQYTPKIFAKNPILCENFHLFAESYSGPKFSFIHCDFPRDVETQAFYKMFNTFINNIDKFASRSSNLMIWIDMDNYNQVGHSLTKLGFQVNSNPLIWTITGHFASQNLIKLNYKAALIANRHDSTFIKQTSASYSAPLPSGAFHPEQLSKSVLRHFFQLFISPTTTVFDPSCGSGVSLQVAEELGAANVCGIEIDKIFAATANLKIQQNRALFGAASLG